MVIALPTSKVRKFKHTFATPTPSSSSSLSPEIQTSLLQVGMRVRKSIGQGYRTQTALEEAKLRSERAALLSKTSSSLPSSSSQQNTRTGSNNGGITILVDGNVLIDHEEDDEGFPSGSQDSLASVESTGSVKIGMQALPNILRKKRGFDLDEDEGIDEGLLFGEQMDAMSTCLRTIAQPKSRIQATSITKGSTGVGVQNSIVGMGDFEEADFLVANEWE